MWAQITIYLLVIIGYKNNLNLLISVKSFGTTFSTGDFRNWFWDKREGGRAQPLIHPEPLRIDRDWWELIRPKTGDLTFSEPWASFYLHHNTLAKWHTHQNQDSFEFCCCCLVAKSFLTLCNPVNYSLPDSSVRGISQARMLEWVAISFSRGSSRPRDKSLSLCLLHWQVGSLPLSH